ncbi:GtrA family protein [Pseudidiomarina gelatinasegens]|uniref:GtrA family protein n=1 Tax=Pseudidiomarina gelatinasegens TaxID=2487740 RepID=UPI003A9786D5
MNPSLPVIVIPAFNPDQRLLNVVADLQNHRELFEAIVIVNDGSESTEIFTAIPPAENLHVLSHDDNCGKGAALKTAFRWVRTHKQSAQGVVTADADGQHLPEDIVKVLQAFKQQPQALWLGSRNFKEKGIPFRSRLGNTFARYTFQLGLRIKVPDTQTGLRGIPNTLLDDLINTPSNHYEFELDMLILAKRQGLQFCSTEITTVYEQDNASSHFKPLQDSIIIYKNFLKFSGVGIASAGIDYGLFALIYGLTGEILVAIAAARLVSGVFNFTLNRQWVFGRGSSLTRDATKYTLLAVTLVGLNYVFTKGLLWVGVTPFIGKPLAEVIVFLLSYRFQKKLVFGNSTH